MDASIEDMLRWAIAELRVKHAEAEAVFPWTTKEEYQYRKAMMDEFNICAWNNVPFILDQLEARMSKPNVEVAREAGDKRS